MIRIGRSVGSSSTLRRGYGGYASAPGLSALSVSTVTQRDNGVALILTGVRFTGAAVGRVNGAARSTIVDSTTQLTVTIPKSDFAAAGTLSVDVRDVTGTSSALPLTVSAWTPSSIVNASARWRVRAGGMTESPAGFVQTLSNLLSPGTSDLTQATSANRVELIPADATFNGKPSIRRNAGLNQHLLGPLLSAIYSSTAKVCLLVGAIDAAAGTYQMLLGSLGAVNGIYAMSTTLSTCRYRNFDGSFDETTSLPTGSPAFGTAMRIKATHAGGVLNLNVNGAATANVASGATTTGMAANLYFGPNTTAANTMRMTEAVTLNGALSAADDIRWRNYVEDEYAIAA